MRDPCAMTVLWGKRRATLWQPCGLASATELRGMCPNSKPRAALRLLGYYQVLRESWGLVLKSDVQSRGATRPSNSRLQHRRRSRAEPSPPPLAPRGTVADVEDG